MLAPFVLQLVAACTFMLVAGWAGDLMARWIGVTRTAGPAVSSRAFDQHRRIEGKGITVCGACGTSGEWLFPFDHPERN